MAIPKYTELYSNVLKALSDRKEHSIREIKEIILDELNLTEDERNETTRTGINKIIDRINWAKHDLKKAGLIESKQRGFFNITDLGLKELNENPNLTQNDLMKYPSFVYYKTGKPPVDTGYNELASEVRWLKNKMNDMERTVHDTKDIAEDTNKTVHDTKDIAEDTNETVHIIDYKMDQFLEKFEEYHKEYAKDLAKISEKVDENISEEELDKIMKKFTDKCSEEIKTCVETSIAKEDYKKEEERLISSLTNENWNKLSKKSQTWLTTSIITYKGIKKLEDIVDYSGVCLLVTKAFEVELYKRFFKGFSDYLFDEYKKDYTKYHTSLVGNYFHGHKYRLKKPRECDLGTITYVFCYKKDEKIKDERIHQNNIDKLVEYSKPEYFNGLSEEEVKNIFYTYGKYVDTIRKDYRNRAAHDKELSITDARSCFNYVFKVDRILRIMLDSFDK